MFSLLYKKLLFVNNIKLTLSFIMIQSNTNNIIHPQSPKTYKSHTTIVS